MKTALIIQGPFYSSDGISTDLIINQAESLGFFDQILVSKYDEEILNSYSQSTSFISNDDPGSECYDFLRKGYININRQVASTQNALKNVKDYDVVLRIRSDICIHDKSKFISYIKAFSLSQKEISFCDITSPNYKKNGCKFQYHLCDWVIGLKKKYIHRFMNIPKVDEKALSDWAKMNPTVDKKKFNCHVYTKYAAEQWLTMHLAENKICLENIFDHSESIVSDYEKFLSKVYYFSFYASGFKSQKYKFIHFPHSDRLMINNGKFDSLKYHLIGSIHKLIARLHEKVRNLSS